MKKVIKTILLISLFVSNAISANYEYIDKDDYYYIQELTGTDQYVVVVRKMGDNKVKVRNLDTLATDVVYASSLLTKSQLENANIAAGVGGTLIVGTILYCIFNPKECK